MRKNFFDIVIDPVQLVWAVESERYDISHELKKVKCPECGKENMATIVHASNTNITFEKRYHCPRCTYYYIDYGEGYSDGFMIRDDLKELLEEMDVTMNSLKIEYNDNDKLTEESIDSILNIKQELRTLRQEHIRFNTYFDEKSKELHFHSEEFSRYFKPISKKMAKKLLENSNLVVCGIDDEGQASIINDTERLDDFYTFAIDKK